MSPAARSRRPGPAHAAHRGQLEDAQDAWPRPRRSSPRCCRGCPRPTASTSRSAPPSPRWARWSTPPGARAWRSTPRTCTRPITAPSPARSRRRCSPSSTSRAWSSGHSERRQYFGETDKALGQKVPAALAAGLLPVLCVGETEDERENGDTQRKLRHQVAGGPGPGGDRAAGRRASSPTSRSGRSAPARWRPRSRRRTRSPSSGRWSAIALASRPHATRILYGGSVKPDNAAELLALPDVDGALVGGASLDAESFAALVAAAARRRGLPVADGPSELPVERAGADRARRLGAGRSRARQRRGTRRHAGVRRAVVALSHHDAHRERHGGRPPRGPDGQLRGRPSQPRRRQRRHAGPHPHRRCRRER